MKLQRIFVVLLMLTLLVTISPSQNVLSQYNAEREWDFEGLIPTQSERAITTSVDDPYQNEYHIFLFDNEESLVGPETIIAFYGLAKILNAPLFTQFFWNPDVTTGSIYRFVLNKTAGLYWINITSDVTNPNSTNYDPVLEQHYNTIKSRLISHEEIYEDENPFSGDLIYPIHFVDLTISTGIVGYWEQELRDGTIIGGRFYTYGPTDPLFVDQKSGEIWPNFNITTVQDNYRSAHPREHAIKVPFPFVPLTIGAVALTVIFKRLKKMRGLQ